MDTNTKTQLNFIAKPAVILFVIAILMVTVVSFGINKINIARNKIAIGNKTENTLKQRVQTLETVTEILPGDVTFLDVVLPSKGSVLYGLSQIKSQALSNNMLLSSLKTGTSIPESDGVFKTSISFEVEGDEKGIYQFLDSFSRLLPLMIVDKVNITKTGDHSRASVSVSVFSSELPKKIPALTESITEFSSDDIKTLNELSSYQMPQFVEPAVQEIQLKKIDPFN